MHDSTLRGVNWHCIVGIALILTVTAIVGCGQSDTDTVTVTRVMPVAGADFYPEEEVMIQFSEPIVPSSGTIELAGESFTLSSEDPTDTITWNPCFRVRLPGEQITLIVSGFRTENGDVQEADFETWYIGLEADYGLASVLAHTPNSETIVDPESLTRIEVVFNRPLEQVTFVTSPNITGVTNIHNDWDKCTGIAELSLAETQLEYSTQYQVTLEYVGILGQGHQFEFSFATQAQP